MIQSRPKIQSLDIPVVSSGYSAPDQTDWRRKCQLLLQSLELGVIEIDQHGAILSCNDWFILHFLHGQPFAGLHYIDEIIPEFDQLLDLALTEQGALTELRNTAHQSSTHIRFTCTHSDGGGYTVLVYDRTAQVLQSQLHLQAREEIEEARTTEKLFLANMSHEMRTPLNSILGMSHMLLETPLSEEQREYVSLMCSSADLLQNLVTDVLDLAELQVGKVELQQKEFDPVVLIHAIHRTFELQLEQKPVTIQCLIDPAIHEVTLIGDDLLLNQVLNNLMSNAVKFTPVGAVKLEVQMLERRRESVELRFVVEDEGIGIPQDKLPIIFQTFRQVDVDIKRRFGGTGLGLAITKEIVDLQQGSIDVQSEVGKGTRFEVTLTYKYTTRKVTQINNSGYVQQLGLLQYVGKVLVVEDNKMNRRYVAKLFEKWKVPYVMAHDGREAVLMTKSEQFALIMMDIQMPIMDGYETTIRIRNEHNLNQNTPIIALTASALLTNVDRAYQVGMTDYLSKPFSPAQLLEKITQPAIIGSKERQMLVPIEQAVINDAIIFELYESDTQYAAEMFEIYLDTMVPQFGKADQLIQTGKLKEAALIVHKLKPASHMVGLPYLESQLEQLETLLLKSDKTQPPITHTWQTILNFLQQALPQLHSKHAQLKRTSYEEKGTHH